MGIDLATTPRSIRAGWRATLATPVMLCGTALGVVVVGSSTRGLGLALLLALFAVMSLLSTAARRLELRPDVAVMHGMVMQRSIPRSAIVSVQAGSGWRTGVTIRGTDRAIWAPVGDHFLGGVSDRRLAEIRAWAFDL